MLAKRTRKLCGVSRLYILYAAYSSSTYCWNDAELRQWVTSLSFFWPANSDVGGGGAVKSTLSGGKSQTSDVRRVMPRSCRLIGRLCPLGSVEVPAIALLFSRLCARLATGAWMTMWIGSSAANRGFAGSWARAGTAVTRAQDAKIAISLNFMVPA